MITYAVILCLGAGAGLLMGAMLAANCRAKDLQDQGDHYRAAIGRLERTNQEDVTRLRADYAKRVTRDAAELHRRECKNIRRQGKKRGAVTGAGA